jgi:hypothetical protein
MTRQRTLRLIERSLGKRALVWFGTRGDDIEMVTDLRNLEAAFSVIAGYRQRATIHGAALEDYSHLRVDLDTHDIDEDPLVDPIRALRRDMLASLDRPSAVFTYRPSTFVSAVCFARLDSTDYLGMFKGHQSAFEHKPWVESAVAQLNIPHLRWRYVADDERAHVVPLLRRGPLVLRRSRSSGGVGVVKVESEEELESEWPSQDEAFVSVAPYLDGGLPVNIGAVVWDTDVTVHYPSVQLIGIPSLTSRPFGYCGNDFGAAADWPARVLDQVENSTILIGRWLQRLGYRGAFGVDYLVKDGQALFMEVNARFQGSTHLSSRISRMQDESCIILDHLAANLHANPVPSAPLRDRVKACPKLGHVVLHWLGSPREGLSGTPAAATFARTPRLRVSRCHPAPRGGHGDWRNDRTLHHQRAADKHRLRPTPRS